MALVAAGFAACSSDADDSAQPDAAAATTVPTSAAPPGTARADDVDIEAAFEFARCMREHGIEDFADPQIRADGDFSLRPPADVDDEELKPADEACAHIATWRSDPDAPSQTAALADGWERIMPGGHCQCADGSPFSFWFRQADPAKVVFYLQDGGACWSAETCAPDRDLYTSNVGAGPTAERGIFDLTDERNPFADYSFVYVPYCTGDVHLGDTTTDYAPGLVVHHEGYVNATAALDHLATSAPDATDVVVIGESAGSIAAPLYAGLASDRFPGASITVLADGSGSYPDVPVINDIAAAWGGGDAIAPWPDDDGGTAGGSGFPGLTIESGHHAPGIVFARHDYAFDATQQMFIDLVGVAADDLLSLIDANERQIEDAGVDLLSYIAPGDEHTVLSDGRFYTEEVNGQRLVDWVTSLTAHQPVDDVHCTRCASG